jgi:hypothetical protein
MTEYDARAVLLLRAFESAGEARPIWTATDANAADDTARRQVGETARFEDYVVARAQAGAARITQREPIAGTVLKASGWPAWVAGLLVLLALGLGIASDALGGGHRINLLAPPLLALVAWNIVVYVVLIVHTLVPARNAPAGGPLRRLLIGWLGRRGAIAGTTPSIAARAVLATFLHEWTRRAHTLYAARVALVLHTSAAALVLGALLSLYARGLVLEYRAGWDSTFLSPADTRAVLATVLGPASWLSGIALPDTVGIAAIRFSLGPGENAAHWIHLFAITLALLVIVPRLVLAAVAATTAHRLATRFPLALDDPYFARLRRDRSGHPIAAKVLPYSYHLSEAQRDAVRRFLEQHVAARVDAVFADALPLGAEDDVARWIGTAPGTPSSPSANLLFVVLFALTATPEREQHGALVQALAAQVRKDHIVVLVDESGFRRRFSGDTLEARLDERRAAWRSVVGDAGLDPLFADLDLRAAGSFSAGAPAGPARG